MVPTLRNTLHSDNCSRNGIILLNFSETDCKFLKFTLIRNICYSVKHNTILSFAAIRFYYQSYNKPITFV